MNVMVPVSCSLGVEIPGRKDGLWVVGCVLVVKKVSSTSHVVRMPRAPSMGMREGESIILLEEGGGVAWSLLLALHLEAGLLSLFLTLGSLHVSVLSPRPTSDETQVALVEG